MSGRDQVDVYGGVDTHRDTHVGAVVDATGRLLGSEESGPTPQDMCSWRDGFAPGARWFRSVWKAPAVTAPAWPVI